MKRLHVWLFAALGLCVAVVYCRAALGPLHMSTDAVDYFRQAGNIVHGRPLYFTQQPAGYPLVLAGLNFAGCATIHGVVAFNLIALSIACVCSWQLIRGVFSLSETETSCVLLMTLASVPCIGFATAAMSEVPFFAASMVALVCLEQSLARRSWKWLIAGIIFAVLSIELRTVGWALTAAVLVTLCQQFNLRISKRRAIATLLITAIPLAVVLVNSRYVYDVAYGQYASFGSPARAAVELAERKVNVIGEMVANYEARDVPLIYREEFVLLGTVACLIFAIGAWTIRQNWSPTTAYLTLYSAAVWAFPFWESRFWLPVLPLLIIITFFGLREIGRRAPRVVRYARPLLVCYAMVFVLLGCRYSLRYASFWDGRADKAISSLREMQ
jgi:hypothetical protein